MRRALAVALAGVLLAALAAPILAADEMFSGALSGASEVPAVTTNGAGAAYVFINEAETEVKYAVSYTGLSGPPIAAHIHVGPAGANGPIVLPLQVGPSTMFGTLTQVDLQANTAAPTWAAVLDAIRTGRAYVKLHTAAHPGGEVRGQLAPEAASPSPSGAATPAPTSGATPRPTGEATPAPTTTAAAATPAITPPPTSTVPENGGGSGVELGSVALVLAVAAAAGTLAAWKLQPARRTDDWD
jgi:hypothetical protein